MRIRKRSVPLPFSLLSPPTTTLPAIVLITDPPPLKPGHYEKQVHHSVGNNNGETETTHLQQHKPSDQQDQSPNLPKLEEDHHHQDDDPPHRSSSDLQLTIIRTENGWICSDNGDERRKEKKKKLCTMNPNQVEKPLDEKESRSGTDKCKSSSPNTRKRNGLDGAEAISGSRVPSLSFISPDQAEVGMRWREGEKAFQLKKRSRGVSFERRKLVGKDNPMTMATEMKDLHHDRDQNNNKIMMMKSKQNTKTTNTKKLDHHHHEHEKDLEEDRSIKSGKNKRENGGGGGGGGGVVMKGSRCSRVNGSGWRCRQQTLIGYSLCEHHLGKGRMIKSMSSIRSRFTSTSININKEPKKMIIKDYVTSTLNEDEEEEPLLKQLTKKIKKKIGKVKDRSLSSLLGQTQHVIT